MVFPLKLPFYTLLANHHLINMIYIYLLSVICIAIFLSFSPSVFSMVNIIKVTFKLFWWLSHANYATCLINVSLWNSNFWLCNLSNNNPVKKFTYFIYVCKKIFVSFCLFLSLLLLLVWMKIKKKVSFGFFFLPNLFQLQYL